MSRPRLTEAEHRLKSEYRKPRFRAKPKTSVVEGQRPRMPKTLSLVAKEHWKRVVGLLSKRRTLTAADAPALEILAESYSRWRAVLRDIELYGPMLQELAKDGSVKHVQNPAAKMAAQLENSMRQMLVQLSATPASREKTRPAAPDPKTIPHKQGTVGWYRENASEFEEQDAVAVVAEDAPKSQQSIEVSESDCDFNAD